MISVHKKMITEDFNPERDDFSTTGALTIKNNSIRIQPEELFDLMNINGKQVKMRVFKQGGFETTAQPQLFISQENVDNFTLKEFDEIDRLAFLLHGLYSLADGDWNSELFDYCIKINCFTPPYNLAKELSKISIDPKRTFSVNGKSYICRGNSIFAYNKKY